MDIVIGDKTINKIKGKYEQRLKTEKELEELVTEIEKYKVLKEVKSYSLNYDVRMAEKENTETNRNVITKLGKSDTGGERLSDIYLSMAEDIAVDLVNFWK